MEAQCELIIEPDVPISGIRLSDWFHREAHGATALLYIRHSPVNSTIGE
jgi:hypothetical protein